MLRAQQKTRAAEQALAQLKTDTAEKLAALQDSNQTLAVKFDAFRKQSERLLKEKEDRLIILSAQVDSLSSEKSRVALDLQRTRQSSATELTQVAGDSAQQLLAQREIITALEEQLIKASRSKAELQKQLETERDEQSKALGGLRATLNDNAQTLRKQVRQLERQVATLEQERDNAYSELDELLAKQEKQLEKLREQHGLAIDDKNLQIKSLSGRLTRLREENEAQLALSRQTVARLQKDLKLAQQREDQKNAQHEIEISRLKRQTADANRQRTKIQADLEKLRSEALTRSSDQFDQLKAKLVEKEDELRDAQAKVRRLANEKDSLAEQQIASRRSLAAMTAQLTFAQDSLSDLENQSGDKLGDLKAELEATQKRSASQRETLDEEVRQIQARLAAAQSEKNAALAGLDALRREHSKQLDKLQAQLSKTAEQASVQAKQLQLAIAKQANEAELAQSVLQDTIARLEGQLENAALERKALTAQLENQQRKTQLDLQVVNKEVLADLAAKNDQISQLAKALEDVKRSKAAVQAQLEARERQHEEQLAALKQDTLEQLAERQQTIAQLELEAQAQLDQSLDKLSRDLRDKLTASTEKVKSLELANLALSNQAAKQSALLLEQVEQLPQKLDEESQRHELQLSDLTQSLDRRQSEMADLQAKHQSELQGLTQSYERQLLDRDLAITEWDQLYQDLNKQLEANIQAHDQELTALKQDLLAQLAVRQKTVIELEFALDAKTSELADKTREFDEAVAKIRQEALNQLANREQVNSEREISLQSQTQSRLDEVKAQAEQRLQSLQAQLDAQLAEANNRNQELEAQLVAQSGFFETTLTKLKQDTLDQLATQAQLAAERELALQGQLSTKLNEAAQKNQALEVQIVELTNQAQSDKTLLNEQISQLGKQLENALVDRARLRSETERLKVKRRSDLEDQELELSALTDAKILEKDEEIQNLEKKLEALAASRKAAQNELVAKTRDHERALAAAKQTSLNQMVRRQEKITKLETELQTLRQTSESQALQIQELEQRPTRLAADEALKAAIAEKDARIAELEDALAAEKRERSKWQRQAAALTELIDSLEAEAAQTVADLESKMVETETLRSQLNIELAAREKQKSQIDGLQNELVAKQGEASDLSVELTKAQGLVKAEKQLTANLQTRLEDTQGRLSASENKLVLATNLNEDLAAKIESLNTAIADQQNAASQLQVRLNETQDRLAETRRTLRISENRGEELTSTRTALSNELADAKESIMTARTTLGAEIRDLQIKVSELQTQAQLNVAKQNDDAASMALLVQQLERSEKSLASAQNRINAQADVIDQQIVQLEQAEADAIDGRKREQTIIASLSDLRANLDTMTSERDQLSAEVSRLLGQSRDFKRREALRDERIDALTTALEGAELRAEAALLARREVETASAELKVQIQELTRQRNDLGDLARERSDEIAALTLQLQRKDQIILSQNLVGRNYDEAITRLAEAEVELTMARMQISKLAAQLKQMQDAIILLEQGQRSAGANPQPSVSQAPRPPVTLEPIEVAPQPAAPQQTPQARPSQQQPSSTQPRPARRQLTPRGQDLMNLLLQIERDQG